jgi:hypothetical protein
MRTFCTALKKKSCHRNTMMIFFYLLRSYASHVFQIVILRVSVEQVDVAVVCLSLVSFFFKSFNKKKV